MIVFAPTQGPHLDSFPSRRSWIYHACSCPHEPWQSSPFTPIQVCQQHLGGTSMWTVWQVETPIYLHCHQTMTDDLRWSCLLFPLVWKWADCCHTPCYIRIYYFYYWILQPQICPWSVQYHLHHLYPPLPVAGDKAMAVLGWPDSLYPSQMSGTAKVDLGTGGCRGGYAVRVPSQSALHEWAFLWLTHGLSLGTYYVFHVCHYRYCQHPFHSFIYIFFVYVTQCFWLKYGPVYDGALIYSLYIQISPFMSWERYGE